MNRNVTMCLLGMLLMFNSSRLFAQQRMISGVITDLATKLPLEGVNITKVQDFHWLRPIPIAEMQALQNAAEFGQNPGY